MATETAQGTARRDLINFDDNHNVDVSYHTQFVGVGLDSFHVFGADVDRFVKDGDGFDFGHGVERRAQICLVAFRIGGRDSHIDVQASFVSGTEGGDALRRCWRSRFINLREIIAQCRQAHSEQQARAEAFEQIKIGAG